MPSNRELLDPSRMPRHVGIIMDGNGRWATERRYPRVYGHRNASPRGVHLNGFICRIPSKRIENHAGQQRPVSGRRRKSGAPSVSPAAFKSRAGVYLGKYRTSFESGGQLRREGRISPCGEEDLFPGPEWKSYTRGNQ